MITLNKLLQYSQNLNILYVEDEPRLKEQMTDVLEDIFNIVDSAKDGEEGILKYNEFYDKNGFFYDIVITDINMPKLNGIDMIKRLKPINIEQKFIVISAYSDSEKLLSLIDLGINYFLLKPIKNNTLMEQLYKVSKNIRNKKDKDKHFITQAKNAAMGEMIDIIAHQWLAQVNIMKMRTDLALVEFYDKSLNDDDIKEYFDTQLKSFTHLVETLNEFRGFFKLDTKKEDIIFLDIIDSLKVLLKDNISKNYISCNTNIEKSFKINVIPNEFKQIFINLIQNSIEAFNEKGIEKREIYINSYENDKNKIIEYIDNAGGIDETYIKKILEPHFTTKKTGTGMGMYLIKLILNKIDATISIENYKEGIKFILYLKKED